MADLPVFQPLHPDVVDRLDPEYVAFHKANLLHVTPTHQRTWDPSIRNTPTVPGSSPPLKVGSVKDIDLKHCKARVFTPEGNAPEGGWPVMIYFHGGGWTLGNIDSENSISTQLCKGASCVVVHVDYRLAPEIPYPAAVDDAVDALERVYTRGSAELGVDVHKIAVGGSSSGGNLAAILAHKAHLLTPPIPLVFQLLIVPVTDNTADTSGTPYPSWKENENTVWLSPERMLWFRNNYLPNKEDWAKWDSSPLFAPDDWFKKVPPACILGTELDILRDEGVAYGEKLKEAGVEVDVIIYKGAPHQTMAMDAVGKAFGTL
ncbi:hypothetical protein JAAARDRAFT_203007 [Jaapia argillacea MUCL 33604]|uniref:Alpha/beta hydrolase fold-3 domain-containing protein n=1 Tax=Jaapia argillacea MUCL 33604 TaxID=933084 RepID=A0A067QJ93_9AGAM|nr:hypothetical protein JAAARDRAFT_203007 [Jaapia argillacea MUCL 33604]